MDSDRKSTVSSFYGVRKSSDAFNNDFPPTSPAMFDNGRTSTAGYNRTSFLHTGREEPLKGGQDEEFGQEEAWDVYADFNNAGPRYSAAFGQRTEGYQQLSHSSPKVDDTMSTTGPVEMVTVPAMGPEWKLSEMREMTKAGKREKKAEERKQKWTAWRRDQRGICGKWFTRRFLVFFLFGLCAAIGLVLAFVIPRVPSFSFNNGKPLIPATGSFASSIPTAFSRAPANFSFPAFADLELDTQSNFIPLTFNHLRGEVFDLGTGRQVASGDLGHKTVPAKSFPIVHLPLNFTYVASNDTDQTWKNWYDSCKNKGTYANGTRPGLKFRLVLQASIRGLPGTHSASTQISDANCPIELPVNSV